MTPTHTKLLEDLRSGAVRLVPGEALDLVLDNVGWDEGPHDEGWKSNELQSAEKALSQPSPDPTPALVEMIEGLVWDLGKQTARALTAEAERDALREALKRLLSAAVLLAGQAEGCIVSHHSEDHAIHGLPGWYLDCVADIAAARALTMEKNDVGE